ncbi:hypothetical protein [uncultured Ilumatobacter sp.]|uniref:hypothetical protein n=1 Tax=uncultured Ilumatobacter sp. TaxID=879968 RepID=UPI00374FBF31
MMFITQTGWLPLDVSIEILICDPARNRWAKKNLDLGEVEILYPVAAGECLGMRFEVRMRWTGRCGKHIIKRSVACVKPPGPDVLF